MKLHAPTGRAAAFTLIELMISTALMALILTSAYLCLQAGFAAQRLIDPRVEASQSARVVLALLAADLHAACPLSREAEFVGMDRMMGEVEADNLDFATHNYTPKQAGFGDYCQVSYYLDRDKETGRYILWRRRNPRIGTDPFSGGAREEIVTGLRKLKFEYYDGFEWYDTWGDPDGRGKRQTSQRSQSNLVGMPEAVRITLWIEPQTRTRRAAESGESKAEPPLVFQTIVRLNLASSSAAGTAPGGTSSGGNSSGTPGTNRGEGEVN